MVRISLWLLLAVFGIGLAASHAGKEEHVIKVEWVKPNKEDVLSITVEEEDYPQKSKKVKQWSKTEKKYSIGDKYDTFERAKRSAVFSPFVAPLVAHPLVAPAVVGHLALAGHGGPVAEAVEEAQRVVNEHVSQVTDAQARIGLDHRQAVIDGLVSVVNDGQWVGELAAQQVARHAQAVGEVQDEVVRAVGDQVAQVADAQQIASIDQAQVVDDAQTAAENSKWVGQLAGETLERQVQSQAEANEEATRIVAEQQAQVQDAAERQGLHAVGSLEDGRWVNDLAKENAEREAQRLIEANEEASRQVSEHQAQALDQAERQGLAAVGHVEDTKWVGQLAEEAAQTVVQNQAVANAELARHLHGVHPVVPVVPHYLKKRETREKRSGWIAQLQHDRINQAHVEAARQTGEAVRVAGEVAREIGEAHRAAGEVVNRHIDAANVHVQSTQWVGPWLHDAATQQSLRVAEAQAEAVRRAGELHRGLAGHHLWKRSGWIAQLHHDRLNQAQIEAARQAGEAVRVAGEVAREVGEAHRAAGEAVNRQIDAANVHVLSKQWVGPWLHDAATQHSLRVAEAQAEAVRQAGELHRGLAGHHLWKRSGWIAQLQHDRLNQAQIEAARQAGEAVRVAGEVAREVGEAHRATGEAVNRHIDAANVHVLSTQWVGPWIQDAVNQRGLRVAEAQAEAIRQANELQRRLTLHHLKKRALRQRRSDWRALLHHDRVNQAQIEAVRQVSELNRHATDVLHRQAGEAVRLAGEAAREVGEAHRAAGEVVNRQIDAANVHVLSKQWVGPWLHDAATQQSLRVAEAQAEAVRRAGELHGRLAGHHLWKRSGWIAQLQHDRLHQAHVEAARQTGEAVRVAGEVAREIGEAHRAAGEVVNRQIDAANVHVLSKQWVGPWLHDAATQHSLRVAEAQAEAVRQAGELSRHLSEVHHLKKREARNKRSNWVAQLINENGERALQSHVETQQEVVRAVTDQQAQLKDALERGGLALEAQVEDGRWVGHFVNEAAERQIQHQGEIVQEWGRQVGENRAQVHDALERGGLAIEAALEDARVAHSDGHLLVPGHLLYKRSAPGWVGQLHSENVETVLKEQGRVVKEGHDQVRDRVQINALALDRHLKDGRWVGQLLEEAGNREVQRRGEVVQEAVRQVNEVNSQAADIAARTGLAIADRVRDTQWIAHLGHEIGARQTQIVGELNQEAARRTTEAVRAVNDIAHRHKRGIWTQPLQAARDHVQESVNTHRWVGQLAAENFANGLQGVRDNVQEAVNTHRWVGQLAAENLATNLQGVRDANLDGIRQVVDINRQIVDNIHNHPYPIIY